MNSNSKFSKQERLIFEPLGKRKEVSSISFSVIDLFAGAGGVTTGIEAAEIEGQKIAEVICAINHDRKAIESHWQNHPHVKHFVEDIKKFNVSNLPKVSDPNKKKFLWASLECTNFSNAKGGLSRDPDSRTLAEHLPRYVKAFDPDYIGIENVREFLSWGPLIEVDGILRPDLSKLGIDYKRWIKKMCRLGYHHEYKILNAADFGAHTSRKRLFIIFAKLGLPIVWPQPTHSKTGTDGKMKWRPVKECLDFSVKGENIFGRKKNLSDNTYKRIYAGLVKFIAKGDDSFLAQYNGAGFDDRIQSGNDACRTLTTANRFAVIQPEFLIKYHGNGKNILSTEDPASSITTKDRLGLVQSEFLVNPQYDSKGNSVDDPSFTLIAKMDKKPPYLVQTEHFLAQHNTAKKGHNPGKSIEQPSPSLTTIPTARLISVDHFIDMQHSQGQQSQSVEQPSGAILTVPKKNLVTVEHFLDQQHGQSKPQSIEIPSNTIVTNPKQNLISVFVMNTNFANVGKSIEDAMFSILASRRHPYLVQIETGEIGIAIDKEDTEIMRKIKMFMAYYNIIAIYMRMLMIPELLKITGFPEDYVMVGTQADKKKYIGNAVPPVVPKAIFESLYQSTKKEMKLAV